MSVERDTASAGRGGDDARFAQLYARCYGPICDYCRRRLAVDAVDDAVAETFLTVWRRIDEVPAGEEALVWIYGVAYRVIGHQWRSTARRRRLQERLRANNAKTLAVTADSTVDGSGGSLVRVALDQLGDTDTEVLRLMAWEQLSTAQVAAVLGIEPDAARQRLFRARRNLARQYDRLQSHPTSSPTASTGGDL